MRDVLPRTVIEGVAVVGVLEPDHYESVKDFASNIAGLGACLGGGLSCSNGTCSRCSVSCGKLG